MPVGDNLEEVAEIRRPEYNEDVYCFDDGCAFHVMPKFCTKMRGGIYQVTMRFVVSYGGIAIAHCQSREVLKEE